MITIRRMGLEDIPFGMRLKTAAGWNQTENDWRRFLELEPEGCFVAEWDGAAVGTITTCQFEAVAWIGMLLVDPDWRRRGIGKRLLTEAMDWAQTHGSRTLRLDATTLGQPLYEKLGFSNDYGMIRFEGRLTPGGDVFDGMDADLEAVCRWDAAAMGIDRRKLLRRLIGDSGGRAWMVGGSGAGGGYAVMRPGSRAWQLGPVVASGRPAAETLIARAATEAGEVPVYLDVPELNQEACELALSVGLKPQRYLLRMSRGHKPAENLDLLWAGSGPEKG